MLVRARAARGDVHSKLQFQLQQQTFHTLVSRIRSSRASTPLHKGMYGAWKSYWRNWKVAAALYSRVLSLCPLTSPAALVVTHDSHTIGFLNNSVPTHIPTVYSSWHDIPANKIGRATSIVYPYIGSAIAAGARYKGIAGHGTAGVSAGQAGRPPGFAGSRLPVAAAAEHKVMGNIPCQPRRRGFCKFHSLNLSIFFGNL